jgi:hypothetical protein
MRREFSCIINHKALLIRYLLPYLGRARRNDRRCPRGDLNACGMTLRNAARDDEEDRRSNDGERASSSEPGS